MTFASRKSSRRDGWPCSGACSLCGDVADGKLFFVGDMNQSIYRFRGAQPNVFLDLRGEVPAAGQLPLTKNFRSQPAVLNFVNCIAFVLLPAPTKPVHRTQCA